MKEQFGIWAALSFLLFCASCSEVKAPRPPEGRCEMNEDCSSGERCIETWCEDIYHPRREIKNY